MVAQNANNNCFAIDDGQEAILVDAGGGNGILAALEATGVRFRPDP
jgi:ribonuclease Z